MPGRPPVMRAAAAFFCAALLLLSSGRLASSDAGEQLKVALLLVTTGGTGVAGTPPGTQAWVSAPNGRRYQVHDIGNVLLMLPAAAIGAWQSRAPVDEFLAAPPVLSRVIAGLSCTVLAALGCVWMLGLLSGSMPLRQAFYTSLLFPFATILIAYARSGWDVLGACVFMAGALRYTYLALRGPRTARDLAVTAALLAAACLFRYSLLPFVAPLLVYLMARLRSRVAGAALGAAAAVFMLGLLPALAYNHLRTGAAWRPATTVAELLEGQNRMSGDTLTGVTGLLISPNRGLFVFSPVLLLGLAIPFLWRRLDAGQREIVAGFGAVTAGYLLLVGSLQNWGTFGWGPRYLVPVLPVFFYAAALGLHHLWTSARPVVLALVACSAVATIPPAVVNWSLATTTFTDPVRPNVSTPVQQIAGWRALAMGLQGEHLPPPPGADPDSLVASTGNFPDLLLVRVGRLSTAGLIVALLLGACAALTAAWAWRSILRASKLEACLESR